VFQYEISILSHIKVFPDNSAGGYGKFSNLTNLANNVSPSGVQTDADIGYARAVQDWQTIKGSEKNERSFGSIF
jgi:hypothetical protein